MSVLPTILIVHKRERRAKCTLEPLRQKANGDFQFYVYPNKVPAAAELKDYVRLSVDGPPLTPEDADRGILLIDATWRLSVKMHADYASVPGRSLPGYKTADRRMSKTTVDPHGGLASIEALYIAYHILGRPTEGLLDDYHWAEEFLAENEGLAPEQPRR